MNTPRASLFIIINLISIFLGYLVYQNEGKRREVKEDLIELSKSKYGVFSVDEWKITISNIISKKVDEFSLNDANRTDMRLKVSNLLHDLINTLENDYKSNNLNSPNLVFGLVKNISSNLLNVFGQMREEVPLFTDKIIDFLDDPENKQAIKRYLLNKLDTYASSTFSQIDYETRDNIIAKYQVLNKSEAMVLLQQRLDFLKTERIQYSSALFLLLALQTLFILYIKNLSKIEITSFSVLCLSILIMGLMLPMIDIDARISEMRFTLLGETILFKNQVLYYKSKSIMEVVHLMLIQGKLDLLFVGVLVFAFSVLFPISKLICSVWIVFDPSKSKKGIVSFLAFKTGKWSMADVMILVIFLAFLGFSGIISEQLDQLEGVSSNLDMITTNQSTLQIGFFLFLSFVLMGLFLAEKLQRLSLKIVS